MGRDLKIGREDFKNGSRQDDSNPSKRLFAKSEFLKAADFFPFIKSIKIFASYTFSWLHLNEIKDYCIISSFLKF